MSAPAQELLPGLVSVSFRSWSPERVVREVAECSLRAIEWGGDVHCPHGDLSRARLVAKLSREAGIGVAAYGSYYRVGMPPDDRNPDWRAVLESAVELGAPVIRVWAGTLGSADPRADEAHWCRVCADARRIAEIAAAAGVLVCFEYHGGVLTDGLAVTEKLLRVADHPALLINWQPQHHQTTAMGLDELRRFAARLANVHVFAWVGGGHDKRALSIHEDRWPLYLRLAKAAPAVGRPGRSPLQRHALLEFFPVETSEALRRDAATLIGWLERD